MGCFDSAFTRLELKGFFQRHVSDALAEERVDAAIGLGDCHQIAFPDSPNEWFVSSHQVQHELSIFGKAMLLGARSHGKRDVRPIVNEAFTSETRRLLTQLFEVLDLIIIKTGGGTVETLVASIAWVAERAGLVSVCIANAAGHKMPKSVVRSPLSLRGSMVSGGIILVDDTDCLEPSELKIVFAAALAGGNKLVLIVREDSDWPRLELLELLQDHAAVLNWSSANADTHARTSKPVYAPRSAIVYPLAGRSKADPPGFPEFAVGPMGDIVTSPDQIATLTAFLSTAPNELQWRHPSFPRDNDYAALARQLDVLIHAENEPDIERHSALDAEEAAFAQMERGPDQNEQNEQNEQNDLEYDSSHDDAYTDDFDDGLDDVVSYEEDFNDLERDI